MREYGAERLDRMFALRSFLDAGIRPTQASDYPPGPFEPMMALQSEVTRTDMKGKVWGAQQKITRRGGAPGGHAPRRLRLVRGAARRARSRRASSPTWWSSAAIR